VKPAAIKLRIEELVLHGFAPHERHAIAEAVQRELTVLLSERGLPSAPSAARTQDVLRAPAVTLTAHARPEKTGAAIARAIYGGLKA
jgi:hypothetical protein